jgi:hypothetical protein
MTFGLLRWVFPDAIAPFFQTLTHLLAIPSITVPPPVRDPTGGPSVSPGRRHGTSVSPDIHRQGGRQALPQVDAVRQSSLLKADLVQVNL